VIDADNVVLMSESVGCRTDRVWLACLTKSSRTCVELNRAGVQSVLPSFANPAAETCILGRFCTAAAASSWLASGAARSLLEVMNADASIETSQELVDATAVPLPGVDSTTTSRHAHGDAMPAAFAAAKPGDAPLRADDRAYLSAVSQDSASPAAALAGARLFEPLAGQELLPRHASRGGAVRQSHNTARPLPSRFASRPRALSRIGGFSRSPGVVSFRPLGKRAAPSLYGLDAFDGSGDDSTASFGYTPGSPLPFVEDKQMDKCTSKPRMSKRRSTVSGTVAGELSSRLNPRSSAREPYHGMLSMKEIKKSITNSRAVWKQQDMLNVCAERNKMDAAGTAPPATERGAALTAGPTCSVGNKDVGRGGSRVANHPPGKECTPAPADASCATNAASTAPRARSTPSSAGVRPAGTRAGDDEDVASADFGSGAVEPRVIGRLAADGDWDAVCVKLWTRRRGTLISGGPGTGKSTFLKLFHTFMTSRLCESEVVVVARTGTAAKTAGGLTYHSFFGFERGYDATGLDPAVEAARLLRTPRFGPVKTRLRRTRVVLLDEISLVGADKLDVMYELMVQTRAASSPPVVWFLFGDFLQLMPVVGAIAFRARCWPAMVGGSFLELAIVHRQDEPDMVQAVHDVRVGICSQAVRAVMGERQVEGASYLAVRDNVLHLMPRVQDVNAHNYSCLDRLANEDQPRSAVAKDSSRLDPNRDPSLGIDKDVGVSAAPLRAALVDCVAPPCLRHALHARFMLLDNRRRVIGLCHGSVGTITLYLPCGTPVVRFHDTTLPRGVNVQGLGVHDAGET